MGDNPEKKKRHRNRNKNQGGGDGPQQDNQGQQGKGGEQQQGQKEPKQQQQGDHGRQQQQGDNREPQQQQGGQQGSLKQQQGGQRGPQQQQGGQRGPQQQQGGQRETQQQQQGDYRGPQQQQGGQQGSQKQQQGGQRGPQQQHGGQRETQHQQQQQQGGRREQQQGWQPQQADFPPAPTHQMSAAPSMESFRSASAGQASSQPQQVPVQQQTEAPAGKKNKYKPQPAPTPQMSAAPSMESVRSASSGQTSSSIPIDQAMGAMKIDKEKIATHRLAPILNREKAFGTKGRRIRVEVNYIALQMLKMINQAFHYDVAFEPETPKRLLRLAMEQFNQQFFAQNKLAFDGSKSCYSAKKLKYDHESFKAEVTVIDHEWKREKTFKITIKEAAIVDLQSLKTYMQNGNTTNLSKPSAAIQCLDVVLRTAYQNNPTFVRFKRSVFVAPKEYIDLGENHELWIGLFQSAILGYKPYINVDVSHKAFPSPKPLIDIISTLGRGVNLNMPLDNYSTKDLQNFLKGMNVEYRRPNGESKIFKFNDVKGPCCDEKFKNEAGQTITVQQYFDSIGYRLKYPKMPCIHVGSTIRKVYVPVELCHIPRGMALNKKHPDRCTQTMIRQAATSTDVRKAKIMDLLNKVAYNNSETVKEFGLSVGGNFEEIDARILDAPHLQYRDGRTCEPRNGVWRADGTKFIQTNNIIEWVFLNMDDRLRPNDVEQFGRMLVDFARKQDINMSDFKMDRTYEELNSRAKDSQVENLMNDLKKHGVKLLIVAISQNDDAYSKVKQNAELKCGILTQCLKSFTIQRKRDPATIRNIMLKINAKMDGMNHHLVEQRCPPLMKGLVMVIGADVTHPSPEQTTIPSVVGVAASHDPKCFKYNCCWRLQSPKDEMIRDFENIVIQQLNMFKSKNGSFPDKIFYYRDGVSDGQFQEILTIELRAMHAACMKVTSEAYRPKITFIVVQKRHHTRFFPTRNGPDDRSKNRNVLPGTIVDTEIVAPNQFQFFLVSHASVQGVAKPTKYCILHDSNQCDPDQLQAMTYYLCHMFTRCDRSVSYPAPTYYAHLTAYRGRVYIKNQNINLDNLEREYRTRQIKQDVLNNHPMFFV